MCTKEQSSLVSGLCVSLLQIIKDRNSATYILTLQTAFFFSCCYPKMLKGQNKIPMTDLLIPAKAMLSLSYTPWVVKLFFFLSNTVIKSNTLHILFQLLNKMHLLK